jgi:hypothetical protein
MFTSSGTTTDPRLQLFCASAVPWRADSMNDAVGVDVDKFPETVRGVVRPHEPTFDTC